MRMSTEMPRYQCHKQVWALKIASVHREHHAFILRFESAHYAAIEVSAEWVDKHKPEEGGYYVVYEDGYASFSPAKAFESGYTLL